MNKKILFLSLFSLAACQCVLSSDTSDGDIVQQVELQLAEIIENKSANCFSFIYF